jgi:hypothetical protein
MGATIPPLEIQVRFAPDRRLESSVRDRRFD